MKKSIFLAMLAILTAALCAMPAWGQLTSVSGKVIDAAGKPIAGATVEWVGTGSSHKYVAKTNDKGEYFSTGIAGGTYNVTVSKDGQPVAGASVQNFAVSADKYENVLDFDLARIGKGEAPGLSAEEKANLDAARARYAAAGAGLNAALAGARAASRGGNYDEAIRAMKELTATDTTHDVLWAQLGEAYLGAGKHASDKATATEDFQQSTEAYQKAIAIKSVAGYHNNLGEALARMGKTQEAIQEYQTAAETEPTEAAKYYFNLGALLTNMGHPDQANDAFDKAIAADPNYAEAYFQKGVNLVGKAKVDDKTGAINAPPEVAADLNKYLELSPTGPNAEAAKQLIASLGEKVETGYVPPKATSTNTKKK
jgi:tetratricopeptide (TPR) repeat protein